MKVQVDPRVVLDIEEGLVAFQEEGRTYVADLDVGMPEPEYPDEPSWAPQVYVADGLDSSCCEYDTKSVQSIRVFRKKRVSLVIRYTDLTEEEEAARVRALLPGHPDEVEEVGP